MAWVKSIITEGTTLVQATCGHCNVINWIVGEDYEGMTCWDCKEDSYFEPWCGGGEIPAEDESLVLGEGKPLEEKSPLDQTNAEIRILREVVYHLFWLAEQGDYSNPRGSGELMIRAGKEGISTSESAKKFIESRQKRMDEIQEHAIQRMEESRESHRYLRQLIFALKQSLALQSNYAKLLNEPDEDGRKGYRETFESFDAVDKWMEKVKNEFNSLELE